MKRLNWLTFTGFMLFIVLPPLSANEFAQPIPFNHKTHVYEYEIPCEFCHVYARRSISSGVPPMQNCAGCHKIITGTTPEKQQEISKLMQYWNAGQVIPWQKVHDLPDFVHFSHKRHIKAGFDCTECHGDIGKLEQITMDTMPSDLSMGWCVNCHNSNIPSRNGKMIAPLRITRGGEIQQTPEQPPTGTIQGSNECLACHQ